MSNHSWNESYVGQLRKAVGHQKLIIPSIRAVIKDRDERILFVDRKGENRWGMPSGSIELNESIYETLNREVKEETGIDVIQATLIAIYTAPHKSTVNLFGDEYQMFEFLFLVDEWEGSLLKVTEETSNAKFFSLDALPRGTDEFWDQHHKEVLQDLSDFDGKLILK
ncbi:NUDIX domain-containing protein [Bacillus sp. BGMRC 2118]|nr:NUDIX domain-containing protein [Bacillus sp. BGMRC 2118]